MTELCVCWSAAESWRVVRANAKDRGHLKKLPFCGLSGSFALAIHFENTEIHKVFRYFQSFCQNKISRPNHQKTVFRGCRNAVCLPSRFGEHLFRRLLADHDWPRYRLWACWSPRKMRAVFARNQGGTAYFCKFAPEAKMASGAFCIPR